MKLTKLTIVFLVLLCSLTVNAGLLDRIKALANNISNMHNKENKEIDIKYGGSAKLDVYFNEDDINNLKPVVIYVHGGAWVYGDKAKYSKIGTLLSEEGFVGVLPNYVLFPFGSIENMVDDIYKTVEWTYNNIEKYGGDKTQIILSGHSAGAHLAALTTIKSTLKMVNLKENLNPLPRLSKLVLFNGPFDFDNYDTITNFFKNSDEEVNNGITEKIVSALFGSDNIGPTDILKKLNINLSDLGFPKVTFYYADKDKMVPESSATGLMAQIRRVCPNTAINYVFNQNNGFDHSTLILGARNDDEKMKKMFIEIIRM